MFRYILGQNIGPEKIEHEYKEFRFSINSLYHEDKLNPEYVFKNCIDNIISDTMCKMLEKYTSKYISAFYNSEIENGTISFGVSDSGEVLGIPIQMNGKDTISKISNYIRKIIDKHIFVKSLSGVNIHNKISIDFVPVDIDRYSQFTYLIYEDFMNLMKKNHQEYINKKNEFDMKKEKYIDELTNYRRSISIIINDPTIRSEFISYMKYHQKYYDFYHILKLDHIDIKSEDIIKYKNDDTRLEYYFTRFRDSCTDICIKNKPIWDYKIKPCEPYYNLMMEYKPMISYLNDNYDKNYKFFVIKISINLYREPVKLYIDDVIYERCYHPNNSDPCCMKKS